MFPLLLCILLLLASMHHVDGAGCEPVSLADIRDAVSCSTGIYDGFTVGQTIKYGDDEGTESGYSITHRVSTKLWKDTLHAVIAKDATGNKLICIRGTKGSSTFKSVRQFVTQMVATDQKEWTFSNSNKEVKVMRYYLEAFKLLKARIIPIIESDWTSSTKFIVTGHSMGGAVASLLALEMKFLGKWNKESALITLGAPRVGNKAYAELHDRRIKPWRKIRLIYNKDPAAHYPAKNYLHHYTEVWVEEYKIEVEVGCKVRWLWGKKKCIIKKKIKKEVEDWSVCKIGRENNKDCANKVAGTNMAFKMFRLNIYDHRLGKYIGAIENLLKDTPKQKKFIADQCDRWEKNDGPLVNVFDSVERYH